MSVFYPNLPTDFVEDPDPPTEPPEEVESSLQEEAPAQHPQPTEEVESPPLEQEALFQPPETPEEMETSSLQEALLAQASEILKEAGGQPSARHRVNEAQQSGRHSVTVTPLDLALTITPEVTKKVEPSPVQQDGLLQAPESPEESETPPVLEEAPPQPPAGGTGYLTLPPSLCTNHSRHSGLKCGKVCKELHTHRGYPWKATVPFSITSGSASGDLAAPPGPAPRSPWTPSGPPISP